MIKLTFTGDVMIEHDRLEGYCGADGSYDFTSVFSGTGDVFRASDYTVANLETPLAGKEAAYTYRNYQFNTPDSIAEAMKESGISAVTTANNHVLDRGIDGLVRTCRVLDEIGLPYTGTCAVPERAKPLITVVKGVKIGLISYTYGTEACYNGNYLKREQEYLVNLIRDQELKNPVKRYFLRSKSVAARGFRFIYRKLDPVGAAKQVHERKESDARHLQRLKEDIAYCKANGADYTVFCLHIGGQFNDEPTEYAKKTAAFALENGADAVVANHEHLIQRACIDDKNRLTAYCLGNFTSNYGIDRKPFDKEAECSVLLHIYLDRTDEGIKDTFAFTVVKSEKDQHGRIGTRTLFDLWESSSDPDYKNSLVELNTKCVNRFLATDFTEVTPKPEYSLTDCLQSNLERIE